MDVISSLTALSQDISFRAMLSDVRLTREKQAADGHTLWRIAGPLTDPSKLRYQAVFIIGAGGSGKSHVSHRWMKYMPGGGSGGASRDQAEAPAEEGDDGAGA